MDSLSKMYEKAYKAICKRIEVEEIYVLHSSLILEAVDSKGNISWLSCPEKRDFYYYGLACASKHLATEKDIASFLIEIAKQSEIRSNSNGKVAVYKNESLESLAVEADLVE